MSEESFDVVTPAERLSEFLLYNTDNGSIRVQVRLYEGSVWLSQRSISDLYEKSVATINEHIANIFAEGELEESQVTRVFEVEREESGRRVVRSVLCYNLEMILSVGYRAKSSRGTQFRQWATKLLGDYVVKGFVMDDVRLSNPPEFGEDYFDELLERIRVIRASEKRLYKKILQIYALSVDYNANLPEAKKFFATVQNKVHYAVHKHTAAEIMILRANADEPHMGMTTWANAPKGQIRHSDIFVAKNYLTEGEMQMMNSLVNQFLEFADSQARRHIPMTMRDWGEKLNGILKLNDMVILANAGKVSHEQAKSFVSHEYEVFSKREIEAEKIADDDEFENILNNEKIFPESKSKGNGEFCEKR